MGKGPNINRLTAKCEECSSDRTWNYRWHRFQQKLLCHACYQRAYYRSNLKKYARSQIEYTLAYRFEMGKRTTKSKNRSWTITFDDWKRIIEQGCHYCSCSLMNIRGWSLDRIDNTRGYDIDNILPCCGWCDRLRSDVLTVEETKIAVRAILDYRKTEKGAH